MARIWLFCIPVLLATTVVMASDLSPEVIEYTTSLILYLSEQEPGIFECWFYEHHISSVSPDFSVLDPIVSSEQLALIPKRILYSTGEVHISRQPSVLVMFCDDYHSARKLMIDFLDSDDFDTYVKFIVFSESEEFEKILDVFRAVKLYEVIFIRTDSLLFGQYLRYRNEFTERSGFVPFDEVFVDQARDLNGYVVKVSTIHDDNSVTRSQIFGVGGQRLRMWIDAAVRALNGSLRIYGVIGGTDQESLQNLYKFNNVLFDLSIFKYTATIVQNQYYLFLSEPGSYGIAVPRGRKLLVIEVFAAPFTFEVWIVLLVVIVCGSLITNIWQNKFKNDIILLSLCGMHCRDPSRTSRLETMIITSLTVLFFVLTSAYEAKVISLITGSAHLPDPRTVEDMIRNNITIQHVSINRTVLKDDRDPRLPQIFRFNPNIAEPMPVGDPEDLHQAYIGALAPLKNMIHRASNLDASSGRRKLRILDDFNGIIITCIPIIYRSPLKRQLSRIEKALFEAGVLQLLDQRKEEVYFGKRLEANIEDNESASKDVGLSELLLGWYMLAIGLGTSSLVFVLEWMIARCGRIQWKKCPAWTYVRSKFTSNHHICRNKINSVDVLKSKDLFSQRCKPTAHSPLNDNESLYHLQNNKQSGAATKDSRRTVEVALAPAVPKRDKKGRKNLAT